MGQLFCKYNKFMLNYKKNELQQIQKMLKK